MDEISEIDRILVSAKQAAEMLGVSPAFFYRLHNAGKVPLPRKLGRRSLWSVHELKAWDRAGCPPRVQWQQIYSESA
ncbi:hypothetical protein ES703_39799 [subsurface metagenome]